MKVSEDLDPNRCVWHEGPGCPGVCTYAAPTIEQRAVRLAEVYTQAFTPVWAKLVADHDEAACEKATHDIAMLLVKRELEAGDG